MSFQAAVDEHFAGAIEQSTFVAKSLEVLQPKGFTADNAIAIVGVCRDELCTPLPLQIREAWGEAFNMSSLAGMIFGGVTAFGAAHAHSPTDQDRERYVYVSMAHIGIGPAGEIGQCTRVGRAGTSKACGALAGLLGELTSGRLRLERDPDDVEQSLLREALARRFDWGHKPGLVELTKTAREATLETLERMISLTVDTAKADYAVFNGVQIHGEGDTTLVWLPTSYAVVGGKRSELSLG
jgi:hypothetical protein